MNYTKCCYNSVGCGEKKWQNHLGCYNWTLDFGPMPMCLSPNRYSLWNWNFLHSRWDTHLWRAFLLDLGLFWQKTGDSMDLSLYPDNIFDKSYFLKSEQSTFWNLITERLRPCSFRININLIHTFSPPSWYSLIDLPVFLLSPIFFTNLI